MLVQKQTGRIGQQSCQRRELSLSVGESFSELVSRVGNEPDGRSGLLTGSRWNGLETLLDSHNLSDYSVLNPMVAACEPGIGHAAYSPSARWHRQWGRVGETDGSEQFVSVVTSNTQALALSVSGRFFRTAQ